MPVWKLRTLDFDYSPQIVPADSKIPAVLEVEDLTTGSA